MKKTNQVAASLLSVLGAAPLAAKTLTIGVDLSSSNPVYEQEFALVAAKAAAGKVAALKPGDVVSVKTFGDRSAANARSERIQITNRNRADKAAAKVARYIASLPSHDEKAQGSTNLVAFFELGTFDCANKGDVLVLSDGIESSATFNARRFVSGKPLPKPEAQVLKGCTVTMFGLGRSLAGELTLKETKHVRAAWQTWMTQAGASFTAIIDP